MDLIEAIKARHSVRKYLDKPIERAKAAQLRAEIDRVNAESGLNVQLVLNEPKAFSSGLWKYGQFSGVQNYLVMARLLRRGARPAGPDHRPEHLLGGTYL